MTTRIPFALAAAMLSGVAGAQLAATAPIGLQGAGPYHRLTLPLAIHGRTAFANLRDLRVRNAAGNAVPYAWLGDRTVELPVASHPVPIYELPDAGVASSDIALGFSVRPDGSLALDTKVAAGLPDGARQWLIDVGKIKGSLLRARFAIAPEARGMFAFRLEASDDMRQWRRVGSDEQLVRLVHGGQTIERLAVDLNYVRTGFLRLRWIDPRHGTALTGVTIDSVPDVEPVAPIEWSPSIQPERCADTQCDYLLPHGFPVQSLRIDLAEPNTLAQLSILGVPDPAAASASAASQQRVSGNPLHVLRHLQRRSGAKIPVEDAVPLLDTVVYRLAQTGGEARSPVVALDGAVYARLRLHTSGPIGVLGATPPRVAVGAVPRTLIFLAQGTAPFSLTWETAPETSSANAEVPGAALSLSTLIPGYSVSRPVVADDAAVAVAAVTPIAAAEVKMPVPAQASSRKGWLWVALGVGLLLLASMAWSLFASLRTQGARSGD